MRKVEIRGLRWSNVDLIGGSLTVHRKTTKTDAGERVIPLNRDALASILEMRSPAKAFLGECLLPDWYVFFRHEAYTCPPEPDKPMGKNAWRRAYRRIVKEPGLAGFRFHDLRHHAITELAEGQTSDMTIMSIAGHVSKKMLERYSHARMEAKRKALDALAGGRGPTQNFPSGGSRRHKPRHKRSERCGRNPQLAEKIGGPEGARTPDPLVANRKSISPNLARTGAKPGGIRELRKIVPGWSHLPLHNSWCKWANGGIHFTQVTPIGCGRGRPISWPS